MAYSLKQLAELTGSKAKGDKTVQIKGVAALESATQDQISFISNPKYKAYLKTHKASAIIISPELADGYTGNALINSDPYLTFAKVVNAFYKPEKPPAVFHPSAVISDAAVIGKNVSVAANTVIEAGVTIATGSVIGANCFIGKNSNLANDVLLYPNVTLYADTQLGSRTIIHSGTVIGSDGFGYAPKKDKSWYKILQVGNVVVGSDVEIGANTTIDRAALGSTKIGNGAKLDNQVQIAHNVEIGDYTIIAGGTMIAGSTKVGKYCQFGGVVAVAGHINITDNVVITGRGMVTNSIREAGVYSSGIALEENRKWRKNAARFRKLDEMAKTLRKLEKKIGE